MLPERMFHSFRAPNPWYKSYRKYAWAESNNSGWLASTPGSHPRAGMLRNACEPKELQRLALASKRCKWQKRLGAVVMISEAVQSLGWRRQVSM